ncbi:MAG: hypothetical protein ACLSAH_07015 [Bilophila wadsworthia]
MPAQPVEEQSVSAPPAPEAPHGNARAEAVRGENSRKQSEQPKQPVEAPVETEAA